jgi:protein-S-isoprenylcysteine O-methyltransferase Ste14
VTHEKPWFPKHYADAVQRLRVPAGIVLAAALVFLAEPSRASLYTALPFAIIGLGIRAWAAGHLAKNENLSTAGPYALIRNPLYLGTLVAALGLAVASTKLTVFYLVAVVFLFVYFPVIEQEEAHLRKIFPGFAAYAKRVPMLIPGWPPADTLGGFRTNLYARNQEYKALIAFALAFAYLWWMAG